MCGCGCELGLVLAACRAEVNSAAVQVAPTIVSPRTTLFDRLIAAWLTGLFGEASMQRSPLENLSRGSGR